MNFFCKKAELGNSKYAVHFEYLSLRMISFAEISQGSENSYRD